MESISSMMQAKMESSKEKIYQLIWDNVDPDTIADTAILEKLKICEVAEIESSIEKTKTALHKLSKYDVKKLCKERSKKMAMFKKAQEEYVQAQERLDHADNDIVNAKKEYIKIAYLVESGELSTRGLPSIINSIINERNQRVAIDEMQQDIKRLTKLFVQKETKAEMMKEEALLNLETKEIQASTRVFCQAERIANRIKTLEAKKEKAQSKLDKYRSQIPWHYNEE